MQHNTCNIIWRAEVITDYLRIIDSLRGPKTAPRIRTATPGQSGAPAGLPRKMYNVQWLEEQERDRPFYVEDELRISEEVFELLVLAADHL